MTMRGRTFLFAAAAAATLLRVAACAPFSSEPVDGGSALEAGTDASTDGAAEVTLQQDGGGDSGECTLVDDDFRVNSGEWSLNGVAVVANRELLLVPAEGGRAGAAWRPLAQPPRAFRVEIETRIPATGNPADGLTFSWADESSNPLLGGNGGELGVCGRNTDALAVAVFSQGTGRLALIDAQTASGCTEVHSAPVDVFGAHKLTIDVDGVTVTASLDGATSVTWKMPRAVRPRYIGLTAATGGAFTAHAVTSIRVTAACAR